MSSIIVKTIETVLEHLQQVIPDVECRCEYFPIADVEELTAIQKPLMLISPHNCQSTVVSQGGSRNFKMELDLVLNKKLQHIDTGNLTNEINELIEIEETIYNEFLKKIRISQSQFRLVADQPQYLILSEKASIQERNCFLGVVRIIVMVYESVP